MTYDNNQILGHHFTHHWQPGRYGHPGTFREFGRGATQAVFSLPPDFQTRFLALVDKIIRMVPSACQRFCGFWPRTKGTKR